MSTRGALGFRVDGIDKVMYNHSDSYPTGLGHDVIEFIKKTPARDILPTAKKIILVDDDIHPTQEQIAECKKYLNTGVGHRDDYDGINWYQLLREAQHNLYAFTVDGLRYMIDNHLFLRDSLFCEWAYIINTDNKTLEIYKGFNKNPKAEGRYASFQESNNQGYFGVRLVKEMPLSAVRKIKDIGTWCGRFEQLIRENED